MVCWPTFSHLPGYWNHYTRSKMMHCVYVLEPWPALHWPACITLAMKCLYSLGTSSCVQKFKAHLLTFSEHPAQSLIEDCWQERFSDSPSFCSYNMFRKVAVDHSLFAAAPMRILNIPPWSLQKPLVNPLSTSLSYSSSMKRHLRSLHLFSGRIYTIHMTSVWKSIQMDQKPLLEPAAAYT